jgi:hypothetical protein
MKTNINDMFHSNVDSKITISGKKNNLRKMSVTERNFIWSFFYRI